MRIVIVQGEVPQLEEGKTLQHQQFLKEKKDFYKLSYVNFCSK